VEIRPALVAEAPALTRLATISKASWGYDEEFMARCASELEVRDSDILEARTYVAQDELGDVVGFYVLKDRSAEEAELDLLFVEPARHGEGVGRALVIDARRRARRWGRVRLVIESDPFAGAFYEACGAQLIGVARSLSTGRELPLYSIAL
jgi:GNAT superfamily N-acetyltransferase